MKKTTKMIGLKTETLRNLAQHEIRNLADHELKAVAGGNSFNNCTNSNRCI
jgi:hypothetical protein